MAIGKGGLRGFRTQAAFRAWLRKNHARADELVLRCCKVHVAHKGVTYAQALDEALCFGWIDGIRRSVDAETFSVRFTPRRKGSIWSQVNLRHMKRLLAAGRVTPPGLAAWEKRDPKRMNVYSFEQKRINGAVLSPAYLKRLKANRKAWTYFSAEAPWYRQTSAFYVMQAKREETREKRLTLLIDCSARGLRIPPLRRS